jgi:preprotein translocase subunit YajC
LPLILAQTGQPEASSAPPAVEQAPGAPGSDGSQGITGQSGTTGGAPSPGPQSLLGSPFVLVLGMLLVIVMTSVFGGRKDKKKRATMMSSLKRHDRVQTLGGIIGTVVEMKDDEVVLRVDEGTNTRIRFAKSAIQQVLRESAAKEGPQVESKPAEKLAV